MGSKGKFTPETSDRCFVARNRVRFDIPIIIRDQTSGDDASSARRKALRLNPSHASPERIGCSYSFE